jgi:hypothetical protein
MIFSPPVLRNILFLLLAASLWVAAAEERTAIYSVVTREIKLLQDLNILSEYANCAISNRFLLPERAHR